MADIREHFTGLEDASTGAGLPRHKVLEGDAAAAKNAGAALVAKDNSNNLVYLNLDAAGNLHVTTDEAGSCLRAGTDGTPVAGSTSKTQVVEIALTAGKTYRKLEWSVCNFRDTIYTMEVIDDPSGTPAIAEVHEVICGPGDFTDSGELHCFEFDTTGYTAPVLRLSGKNLNNPSDFRGTISITEDAA